MEFATLRGIIADQLGIDEDEITMESSFSNDLGADSIDLVEFVYLSLKSCHFISTFR